MARRLECPMCGRYNKRSQDFCPACGTRVDKSAPSVEVNNLKESAPISKNTERRNLALMVVSIIYLIALFLPLVNMPVMDAGPVATSPIMLALMFFVAVGSSTDLLALLVAFLALVAAFMTIAFVIYSIKNVWNYKNGKKTLFSQNVFYLVTIPAIYFLIGSILSIVYDMAVNSVLAVGFFVTLLTGMLSAFTLAAISVDKNYVSGKSIATAFIAMICFIAILACMFQPLFSVYITRWQGSTAGFGFSAADLRSFYDTRFLENHYRNLAENGATKVIADAEYRLNSSPYKGKVLATIIMTVLPATVPMIMLVSIVAIVISASAIFSSLLAKLCTLNEKKLYLVVAKIVLLVASSSFIWSFVQLIIAISKVRYLLSGASTLTFSVMIFPIVALIAAVVMILLNIKEKNYDYIVSYQYE